METRKSVEAGKRVGSQDGCEGRKECSIGQECEARKGVREGEETEGFEMA